MNDAGGLYHVLNRGNYRQWIFHDERTKEVFERTLFEACKRAGWVLHGYCIMSNHYHLALETKDGNLSEGMRWLQSVFAIRFNRFRGESGHLFQGRFKSLEVEGLEQMAWLCHYLHLNPVRAKICPLESLADYRWSSYWYLRNRKKRPALMALSTCLAGAGQLSDNSAGWRRYASYLDWLQEDKPTQKQMAFDRMSRGWAIGTRGFQQALVADEKTQRTVLKLTFEEAKAARKLRWESGFKCCLKALHKKPADAAKDPKTAAWKIGVAAYMKQHLMTSNAWLAEQLHMGVPSAVSRYTSEAISGRRAPAKGCYEQLTTIVKH